MDGTARHGRLPLLAYAVEVVPNSVRPTKAAVPSTVTRPEWLLFGAGITPGTQKAQTATAIWGVALHAMQLLTYHLREEGETFTPATAVLVAQRRLIQAAMFSRLLVGGEPDRMAARRRDDSVPYTRSNENSLGPEVVRADEEGAAHSGRPRSRRGRSIEREVVCAAGRCKLSA